MIKKKCTISKLNRINFETEDYNGVYELDEPLVGTYEELENEIFKILEINRFAILKLWFPNDNKSIYLTNVGVDKNAQRAYRYVFYESLKDAQGWTSASNPNFTVAIAKDWDLYKRQYLNKDTIVCGVLRKDVL